MLWLGGESGSSLRLFRMKKGNRLDQDDQIASLLLDRIEEMRSFDDLVFM